MMTVKKEPMTDNIVSQLKDLPSFAKFTANKWF